jgi:hypothetical protein
MPKWSLPFDEPIELPDGKTARTLRQAADYVMALPRTEHDHPKWQHATGGLLMAAQDAYCDRTDRDDAGRSIETMSRYGDGANGSLRQSGTTQ